MGQPMTECRGTSPRPKRVRRRRRLERAEKVWTSPVRTTDAGRPSPAKGGGLQRQEVGADAQRGAGGITIERVVDHGQRDPGGPCEAAEGAVVGLEHPRLVQGGDELRGDRQPGLGGFELPGWRFELELPCRKVFLTRLRGVMSSISFTICSGRPASSRTSETLRAIHNTCPRL